jgi:chromosome segregation ATPase
VAQKAAETAYSTLSKEYSGLERRIQLLRQEMEVAVKRIDDERAVHRKQLMQLEILLDQERQQQEKADRQVQEMATLLRSYQATEENVKRLETEMQTTVHEMRWAIRLQRSREHKPPGTL